MSVEKLRKAYSQVEEESNYNSAVHFAFEDLSELFRIFLETVEDPSSFERGNAEKFLSCLDNLKAYSDPGFTAGEEPHVFPILSDVSKCFLVALTKPSDLPLLIEQLDYTLYKSILSDESSKLFLQLLLDFIRDFKDYVSKNIKDKLVQVSLDREDRKESDTDRQDKQHKGTVELVRRRWSVKGFEGNLNFEEDDTNHKQTLVIVDSKNSNIVLRGTIGQMVIENCENITVMASHIRPSATIINSKRVTLSVENSVSTVEIESSDRVTLILHNDARNTSIFSRLATEMTVKYANDDVEVSIPERILTVRGKDGRVTHKVVQDF